jgi:type IV pilus assembly protein PilC
MEIQKDTSAKDLMTKLSSQNIELGFLEGKPKIKDVAIFCRMFATIINAGVSIMQALEITRDQTESKPLKKALEVVLEEVKKGRSFSEGLSNADKAFPEFLINMVRLENLVVILMKL